MACARHWYNTKLRFRKLHRRNVLAYQPSSFYNLLAENGLLNYQKHKLSANEVLQEIDELVLWIVVSIWQAQHDL